MKLEGLFPYSTPVPILSRMKSVYILTSSVCKEGQF